MSKKPLFKNDSFRKHRGGRSRWLLLSCEKCDAPIATYQKDGPGPLKRLYLDRIQSPDALQKRSNKKLVCSSCKQVLGVQYVYEKEKRPAYRLFVGAIQKRLIKGDGIQKIKI